MEKLVEEYGYIITPLAVAFVLGLIAAYSLYRERHPRKRSRK